MKADKVSDVLDMPRRTAKRTTFTSESGVSPGNPYVKPDNPDTYITDGICPPSVSGQTDNDSGHVRLYRRGLPENVVYHDTGCELSPSCLECDLPQCQYDVPGGVRALQRRQREAAVREARKAGEPRAAVAARLGGSERTVTRITTEMTDHERMVALRSEGLLLKEIARIVHRDHSTVLHHLRGDCKRC